MQNKNNWLNYTKNWLNQSESKTACYRGETKNVIPTSGVDFVLRGGVGGQISVRVGVNVDDERGGTILKKRLKNKTSWPVKVFTIS